MFFNKVRKRDKVKVIDKRIGSAEEFYYYERIFKRNIKSYASFLFVIDSKLVANTINNKTKYKKELRRYIRVIF